jgi:Na+-driven multidrug efflux pump
MWMVPMGFQEAHCTVIGNSMGENNPNLARKYLRLTAVIALSVILTWLLLAYTFREFIASVYIVVKDEETK